MYDKINLKDAGLVKNDKPKCKHEFYNKSIVKEYFNELCDLLINHGRAGYFIESFSGRYNICTESMIDWLNNKENKLYDNFRSAAKISMSASFYYWNCELIFALDNFEELGASIPVLRGILGDIVKTMPKGLREIQFENLASPDTPEQREIKLQLERDKELYASFRGGGNG